jgi:hypothetical protein
VIKFNRATVEVRKSDGRKQAVSIRMSRTDVRQVKRLADRLGVRDSDVIRFAIKSMLAKLAPLPDPGVTGRGLVPVFMDAGPELMSHFDLDVEQLAAIINEGADQEWRVDEADIQLIAMRAIQASLFNMRGAEARGNHAHVDLRTEPRRETNATHTDVQGDAPNGRAPSAPDPSDHEQSLRRYLYDKYLSARFPEVLAHRGATS